MRRILPLAILGSCLALGLIMPLTVLAQEVPVDSITRVEVLTLDGNLFVGELIGEESVEVVLRTEELGQVAIPRRSIKRMAVIESPTKPGGAYWPRSPHDTRYFFQANAYGLRKGEGYYQNTWVFLNQVSYGFTDHFTVGVGVVPVFLLGAGVAPVWVTPKVSFPIRENRIHAGGGGLFAAVLGEEDASFGIAYGNITFGSRHKNLTLNVGYGYAGNDWASTPTIGISGMIREGRKFAFITENYLIDAGDDLLVLSGLGGRFLGRSLAIDGAFILPLGPDFDLIILPWLSVTVPFGSGKLK